MKKENFVSMILGLVGGILFALGMVMCLQPEFGSLKAGIVLGVIGAIILIAMLIVRRKMQGRPPIQISGKVIGLTCIGIVSTLVFGWGMVQCMTEGGNMVLGIVVGLIGLVGLVSLIPLTKGLK